MKRFIVAAVAAAALAVPAGASADTGQVAIDLDAIEMTCPTPVVSCVQDYINYAFMTVDTVRRTAQYYVNFVVYTVSQPPPINQVCYLVYGEPCTSVL